MAAPSSPSTARPEKRWELFGRRPSSLVATSSGPSFEDRDIPPSDALHSGESSASVDHATSLEELVSTGLKNNEKCLIAVYVSKIPSQEISRGRGSPGNLESPTGDNLNSSASVDRGALRNSLLGRSKRLVGRASQPSKPSVLLNPRWSVGYERSTFAPHSPQSPITREKKRLLALCEGKKSSSQLRLHKIADHGGGKLSIMRTWWLTELTKVDGMGGAVETALAFALVFGESKKFTFAAPTARDRAEFLWEILQYCAARLGRAPPVEGLRILELQTLAESVSTTKYLESGVRRGPVETLSPTITTADEDIMDTSGKPQAADLSGPGDEAARNVDDGGEREFAVGALAGVLSPKARAAEIRLNRRIREQERVEKEKASREKAIREAAAALDEMMDSSLDESERLILERRNQELRDKQALEKKIAQEKEAMKISFQEAEDLEKMFSNHTEVLGTAVNRRKFMDHLAEKIRALERENTHQIIHSEAEAEKVAHMLDSVHFNIGDTKDWLRDCGMKLNLMRGHILYLEHELLLCDIELKNLRSLEVKVADLQQSVTLTSEEKNILQSASVAKMLQNQEHYIRGELIPAIQSLREKWSSKHQYVRVRTIHLVHRGLQELETHRDHVCREVRKFLEERLPSVREKLLLAEDEIEDETLSDFVALTRSLAILSDVEFARLWELFQASRQIAMSEAIRDLESVSVEMDVREMIRQFVSVVSPVCQIESKLEYLLFKDCVDQNRFHDQEESTHPQLSQFALRMGHRIDALARRSGRHLYLDAWSELELEKAFLVMDERNAVESRDMHVPVAFGTMAPLQKSLMRALHGQSTRCKAKLRAFVDDALWQASRAANAVGVAARKEDGLIDDAVSSFYLSNKSLMEVCRELVGGCSIDIKESIIPQAFSRATTPRDLDDIDGFHNLSVDHVRTAVGNYVMTLSLRLLMGAFKNTEVAAYGSNSYAREEMIKIENYTLISLEIQKLEVGFLGEMLSLARRNIEVSTFRSAERFFQSEFGRSVEAIVSACSPRSQYPIAKVVSELGRPYRIVTNLRTSVERLVSAESRELVLDPFWQQLTLYFLTRFAEIQGVVENSETEEFRDEKTASHTLSEFRLMLQQSLSLKKCLSGGGNSLEPTNSMVLSSPSPSPRPRLQIESVVDSFECSDFQS
eukprot:CAMPEP_0184687832 /NCGR_PEP_ID=MMETSP0312-20130426/27683_1 /TAXON_ID=31354 /ORGANISM="Compsopogon coeruleus, Strain SAG 36.94" /LENGTH=1156 /DNA_ID=CAMNT_0027144361 /DNA_START=1240 /DNA_END=4710 /DNA_ORIENTATION=+